MSSVISTLNLLLTAFNQKVCLPFQMRKLQDTTDSPAETALGNYMLSIPEGYSATYKVTEKNHAIYWPPSTTNTGGYCHVKREESASQFVFKCTGKDCKAYVSKGKQEKNTRYSHSPTSTLLLSGNIQKWACCCPFCHYRTHFFALLVLV